MGVIYLLKITWLCCIINVVIELLSASLKPEQNTYSVFHKIFIETLRNVNNEVFQQT
jgi:hypothetical protein